MEMLADIGGARSALVLLARAGDGLLGGGASVALRGELGRSPDAGMWIWKTKTNDNGPICRHLNLGL